jgi:hypothetical protein
MLNLGVRVSFRKNVDSMYVLCVVLYVKRVQTFDTASLPTGALDRQVRANVCKLCTGVYCVSLVSECSLINSA